MSFCEEYIARNIGGTTSGASASSVALAWTSPASFERMALVITASGADDAYVTLVANGASAPTVSSSAYDYHIPSGSTLTLKIGRSLVPYITCGAGYSAKEIG